MFSQNIIISEQLFSLLVESIADYAIFMVSPAGEILTWNKGAQYIKGYSADEIIGQHISVFYTEEDRDKGEPGRNLKAALKKGRHESEGWRLRKNGEKFWANIVFTTIYDTNGALLGFAKLTKDITKQKEIDDQKLEWNKHLEKKIQENTERISANERRFRKLIENSYDGISLFDKDFNIIYRSLSAKRITGIPDQERFEQSLADIIHPEDQDIFRKTVSKVSRQPGEPFFAEFRIARPDGRYIWLECIFTNMLHDADVNAIICNFSDVTAKKIADKKIRESNHLIQSILDRITDGFIALDKNFNYTYFNRKISEMTGMDSGSVLGKNVWHIFPEAIGSRTYYAFQEAFEQQTYIFNEDYFAPLDLWQENSIYPSPEGLSVFVRDISDRKKTEMRLNDTLARLQQASAMQADILNALPPGIALLDEESRIIAVNESWKKFARDNKLELSDYGVGSSYLAICEKAALAEVADAVKIGRGIKDVIDGVIPEFTMEYPCDSPTEKRWYQLIVAPLTEKSKKGAVVLHINITGRKLAEEKVLQSEANLRSVFENTDLSIVLFDTGLNVIAFNSNAFKQSVRYFGRALHTGGHAFDYFPEDRHELIKNVTEEVKPDKSVNYETVYSTRAGGSEWFDVRWVGVSHHDVAIGFILTLKNITGKKNADLEREKMTADLIRRNMDLEQFTYIVSHNLRAPVANIKGLADLLKDNDVAQGETEAVKEALSVSADKLDDVIVDLNNILQISNCANETTELVSLPQVIEQIRANLKLLINENHAEIRCNFHKINHIFGIRSYVYSILQNLITNSIKYRRNKVPPVIQIEARISGDFVQLCLRDNGKGMDLKKVGDHIFGLYKRFDLSVDGKGMGLFMVKTQVVLLGGKISVHSEIDKGTEFQIELPM